MSGRPNRCFGTPAGTTALLLCGQACPDLCFGIPAGATALLLRGQARLDRCFGTPAGATALLLHGQARPDRCFGTPAGVTALQLWGQACPVRCYGTSVLYCTFGYLLCCVLLISYDWSRLSHPIPDPTRMTDPNRVRGARLSTETH